MFVSAEEIDNMNFLGSKQLSDGRGEFSKTKQWKKSMQDIEGEQKNTQQIISEIKLLDEKIDIVLKKLEFLEVNNKIIGKDKKQTETLQTHNSTWKDKLKIW